MGNVISNKTKSKWFFSAIIPFVVFGLLDWAIVGFAIAAAVGIAAIIKFGIRPVELGEDESINENTDYLNDPTYSNLPGNIYHRSDD